MTGEQVEDQYDEDDEISAADAEQFPDWGRADKLTPREKEAAELVSKGLEDKEIAHAMGITPAGAKHHVRNAMHKLAARNRTRAAVKWVEWKQSTRRADESAGGETQTTP